MRPLQSPFAVLFLSLLVGCSSNPIENTDELTAQELDPTHFVDAAVIGDFTEEQCVLSGGTTTTCYRFSVSTVPVDHSTGPWCPETIRDDASDGGIWPEAGVAHDVDGPFIANLDDFYNDPFWHMYDAAGNVNVTDSPEACAAAARPNVDPQYQNHCVECQTSYLEADAQVTYVIPKKPVVSDGTVNLSDPVGVALNGIGFAPPAPTDAILGAYTLAPFDDCGGHVNLVAGYHYHAATGCGTRIQQDDGHAPLIGYALDGFAFYDLLDGNDQEPSNLDACRGHTDATRGYHYHVAEPGMNAFVGCFRGEHGCALAGDGAGLTCDATQRPGRPRGLRGPRGASDGSASDGSASDGSASDGVPAAGTPAPHTHAFSSPHEHH